MGERMMSASTRGINDAVTAMSRVSLSKGSEDQDDSGTTSSSSTTLRVRYMLDYTLNRFCRWLRILGLDAALETEEEERLRTKEGKMYVTVQMKRFWGQSSNADIVQAL